MKNGELYREWLEYILEPEVKDAFLFMLGVSACAPDVTSHIQWKGDVRDFRFIDRAGEQPHSFITNQHWLLFYFRHQAVRALADRRNEFEQAFDSFAENTAGEWTVKLRNVSDVKLLTKKLAWDNT